MSKFHRQDGASGTTNNNMYVTTTGGGKNAPKQIFVAHRRSQSELTSLMIEQFTLQKQLEAVQAQQQQLLAQQQQLAQQTQMYASQAQAQPQPGQGQGTGTGQGVDAMLGANTTAAAVAAAGMANQSGQNQAHHAMGGGFLPQPLTRTTVLATVATVATAATAATALVADSGATRASRRPTTSWPAATGPERTPGTTQATTTLTHTTAPL